jgi:hypothetical protein
LCRWPASLEVVTLDDRLAAAARKEGFPLVDLTPAAQISTPNARRRLLDLWSAGRLVSPQLFTF